MEQIEITVPDGASGKWRVETFTISEEDAKWSRVREVVTRGREKAVEPGIFKRLMHRNDVVMSNTAMEVQTHAEFIEAAKGHVLINGLGLGMALSAILQKPDVLAVTVIEKSEDVIALVAPTYLADSRVQIHCADAFEWAPPADAHFDVVWHDIWTDITSDNLKGMDFLEAKYDVLCDWQGSWAREQCEGIWRPRRSLRFGM